MQNVADIADVNVCKKNGLFGKGGSAEATFFFRVYGNNLSIFNFLGKSFFIPCVYAVDGLGAAHLKGIHDEGTIKG